MPPLQKTQYLKYVRRWLALVFPVFLLPNKVMVSQEEPYQLEFSTPIASLPPRLARMVRKNQESANNIHLGEPTLMPQEMIDSGSIVASYPESEKASGIRGPRILTTSNNANVMFKSRPDRTKTDDAGSHKQVRFLSPAHVELEEGEIYEDPLLPQGDMTTKEVAPTKVWRNGDASVSSKGEPQEREGKNLPTGWKKHRAGGWGPGAGKGTTLLLDERNC